jgi:uncharacterized OB-fold protein
MTTPGIDAVHRASLERGAPQVPQCTRCGTLRWPPREVCHACLGSDITWCTIGGEGTVVSFVVVRDSPNAARQTPYCVVHVELDEGVRMTTNLLNADPASVRVGQRVRAVVERTAAGPLLQFEPGEAPATGS